jgi:hypothetical protein
MVLGAVSMSFSKSPLNYEDVRRAFDKALGSPRGIKIKKFKGDYNNAQKFRQRAYFYRRQARLDNMRIYPVGHRLHPAEGISWSIYDNMEFRVLSDGIILVTLTTGDDLDIEEIVEEVEL